MLDKVAIVIFAQIEQEFIISTQKYTCVRLL